MSPALRKLVLTAHISVSAGWLGAVVAFLGLAVAGVTSQSPQTVRAVYLAMELMGWYALVPLAFASLATGLIQSLGSEWGLFRHYWVVFKFLINLFATLVLLIYMQTLERLAAVAAAPPRSGDVDALRSPSPLLHASAALVLLLAATILAVFKPRGLTWYGRRKLAEQRLRVRSS
jgi:ABC-type uncharacterized transport system permease subunit